MSRSDDDVLGLAHRQVSLAESTTRWAAVFAEEAAQLSAALAAHDAHIEHCGSTSVPGLAAKPILDILVGVPAPPDVPGLAQALAALGYQHAPRAGVPGHEVFGKGAPRTHLLHVVLLHGAAWRRMLRFRDALRADPALAVEYAALERELAARFPGDRPAYTQAKSGFVAQVLGDPDAPAG